MEEPKFDIQKLMRENFKSAPDEPELTTLSIYMLIHTEGEEYLLAETQDIDRCSFIGDQEDEFIFREPNGNLITCKKADYKKRWVAINSKSINGTMLEAAYEELAYMIQNQLPPKLKDKIKF